MNNAPKKISIKYFIILILVSVISTFFLTKRYITKSNESSNNLANSACNFEQKRIHGYKYIEPLLYVEQSCESPLLENTKKEITKTIESYKAMSGVIEASVYLRDYQSNTWMNVNESVLYEPGSLFKVPILIAYLKMKEENPTILNTEIKFETPFSIDKNVAFKSKTIELGKKYTIRELLKYMIVYSDNNATALLNNNLKPEILNKLFSDLNLEVPDVKSSHYYFTPKQYSLFMRCLYNASYLTHEDSEFAASLLSKSEFNKGIVRGLPKNTKLIHKFGESGNQVEKQLHESAIIYIREKPYLLTVMTKGKDNETLSNLIGDISSIVYNNLK